MTTALTAAPFTIDWRYDETHATPGSRSRYSDYLNRHHAHLFDDMTGAALNTAFALTAWNLATGPLMDPPLIRPHPHISDTTVRPSDWNRHLVANITLIAPRPTRFIHATSTTTGRHYSNHHSDPHGRPEGVQDSDLTRAAYLVTTMHVIWQMPTTDLPHLTQLPEPGPLRYQRAIDCLHVITGALNRELTPLLAKIEQYA